MGLVIYAVLFYGSVITLMALLFLVPVFMAIVRNGHSVR